VQIKLNDLDTRLVRIERVVANQSLLELANELEALRSDVRSLHNDFDVLNNNLDGEPQAAARSVRGPRSAPAAEGLEARPLRRAATAAARQSRRGVARRR
jgi:hypothetical protein